MEDGYPTMNQDVRKVRVRAEVIGRGASAISTLSLTLLLSICHDHHFPRLSHTHYTPQLPKDTAAPKYHT